MLSNVKASTKDSKFHAIVSIEAKCINSRMLETTTKRMDAQRGHVGNELPLLGEPIDTCDELPSMA